MKCREIQDLLSPYIDGQLSGKEMAKVREHLLLCPECNREYLLLKEMTELLGALQFKFLPADFDASFRAALELEEKSVLNDGYEFGAAAVFAEADRSEMERNARPSKVLAGRKKRYRRYGVIAAALLVCILSAAAAMFSNIDLTGGGSDASGASSDMFFEEEDADSDITKDEVSAEDLKSEQGSEGFQMVDQENAANSESARKEARKSENGNDESANRMGAGLAQPENLQDNGAVYDGAANGANPAFAQDDVTIGNSGGGEAKKQSEPEADGFAFDVSGDEGAGVSPEAGRAAPTMEAADAAKSKEAVPEAAGKDSGASAAYSGGSGSSSVIDAAYAAGAKTYNEALDFVSFIADNDRSGLIRWITTHSVEKLTEEQAGQLADGYIAKYKANAN